MPDFRSRSSRRHSKRSSNRPSKLQRASAVHRIHIIEGASVARQHVRWIMVPWRHSSSDLPARGRRPTVSL